MFTWSSGFRSVSLGRSSSCLWDDKPWICLICLSKFLSIASWFWTLILIISYIFSICSFILSIFSTILLNMPSMFDFFSKALNFLCIIVLWRLKRIIIVSSREIMVCSIPIGVIIMWVRVSVWITLIVSLFILREWVSTWHSIKECPCHPQRLHDLAGILIFILIWFNCCWIFDICAAKAVLWSTSNILAGFRILSECFAY